MQTEEILMNQNIQRVLIKFSQKRLTAYMDYVVPFEKEDFITRQTITKLEYSKFYEWSQHSIGFVLSDRFLIDLP